MKVLIVDDSAPMRRMIHGLIAPFVEETYECGDGGEALEIYRRFRPDWVLMDIDLPQIDGITAVRQIIAEDAEANILMVTNYDEIDMRRAADEAGASGYVLKDNLLAVRSFLEERSKIKKEI